MFNSYHYVNDFSCIFYIYIVLLINNEHLLDWSLHHSFNGLIRFKSKFLCGGGGERETHFELLCKILCVLCVGLCVCVLCLVPQSQTVKATEQTNDCSWHTHVHAGADECVRVGLQTVLGGCGWVWITVSVLELLSWRETPKPVGAVCVRVTDNVCVRVCVSDGLCKKVWQKFEESFWIFLSLPKSDAALRPSGGRPSVEKLRWADFRSFHCKIIHVTVKFYCKQKHIYSFLLVWSVTEARNQEICRKTDSIDPILIINS